MPGSTAERVDRLEEAFASFMERSEEMLARIDASNARIDASNARIDASNLRIQEMQRQAEQDREEWRIAAAADRKQFQQNLDRQREEFLRGLERHQKEFREGLSQQREEFLQTLDVHRQQFEKSQAEAEKRLSATHEQFQEALAADRKRFEEALAADRKRSDEAFQRDHERAEKERRDFNKRMAELSDSMGTLIEDMVAPNARRIASEIFPDDPAITVAQRVRKTHPTDCSRMAEIDLLAAGRDYLMIFEAKRRLDSQKIREFVEKLESIPEFFPEYASLKIVPVVASVTIEPSVLTFLNRQKVVYGVAMGDETMELVNLGQF
jgi:hypothetical protein